MKKHIAEIAVVVTGIAWGLIALFVDYMKGCGPAPAQSAAVVLLQAVPVSREKDPHEEKDV